MAYTVIAYTHAIWKMRLIECPGNVKKIATIWVDSFYTFEDTKVQGCERD